MFPEFFSQFQGAGSENYKKISKRMLCFMVACVQTAPLPSDFYWREERGVCTQAILWGRQEITYEYYHEYWNYE